MKTIQVIELHGRPVALALGNEATVADHVTGRDRRVVAGMALYALEVQAGTRPGPYTDSAAEQYARAALAQRTPQSPRQRRGAHAHPRR